MTLLSKWRSKPVQKALPQTLDGLFAEIAKCGRLSMMRHDDGTWSARLKVPTTNPAITAQLESGFNHTTPHKALQALLKNTKAPE